MKNMDDAPKVNGLGFTPKNMSEMVNGDQTVMDVLIDVVGHLPREPAEDFAKTIKGLSARSGANIRGTYGEAIARLRLETAGVVGDLPIKEGSLKIGGPVTVPRKVKNSKGVEELRDVEVQGADLGGEIVEDAEVAMKGATKDGRPLHVEVKDYTSPYYVTKKVEEQVQKHLETLVLNARKGKGWDPAKPHLHFEWMGEGFNAARVKKAKDTIIQICKDKLKKKLKGMIDPFDCEKDITFMWNEKEQLIPPLTSKP